MIQVPIWIAVSLGLIAVSLVSITIIAVFAWFGIASEADTLRARLQLDVARMMILERLEADDRLAD